MLALNAVLSAKLEANTAASVIMREAVSDLAFNPVAEYQDPKGVFLNGISAFRLAGASAEGMVLRYEVAKYQLQQACVHHLAWAETRPITAFLYNLESEPWILDRWPTLRHKKNLALASRQWMEDVLVGVVQCHAWRQGKHGSVLLEQDYSFPVPPGYSGP